MQRADEVNDASIVLGVNGGVVGSICSASQPKKSEDHLRRNAKGRRGFESAANASFEPLDRRW